MSTIIGTWLLHMKTPVGTIQAAYRFEDEGGMLGGSASSGDETTPLTDIAVADDPAGQRVTWRQSITKPLRLHLVYDVLVDGDALTGEARAGRLPSARVNGVRTGA